MARCITPTSWEGGGTARISLGETGIGSAGAAAVVGTAVGACVGAGAAVAAAVGAAACVGAGASSSSSPHAAMTSVNANAIVSSRATSGSPYFDFFLILSTS